MTAREGVAMKKIVAILLVTGIVFAPGCYESQEEPSRYAAVPIPEYTIEDYYLLLSHKNPEIVYNAACNLLNDADDITAALNEKTVKSPQKHMYAARVYGKMLQLLGSRDDRVLAAALRFFQLFGSSYDRKEELIKPLLAVRSKSVTVQCEQIRALARVVSKKSSIGTRFLENGLRSRSWLISRCAYSLVDSLRHEPLRMELIEQYKTKDDEAEKLLILTAMRHCFSDRVFEFFAGEILSTKNAKIKKCILKMFSGAEDTAAVLAWVERNYDKLAKPDSGFLAEYYEGSCEEDFSSALLAILVRHGYLPGEKFLEKVNDSILGYESEGTLSKEKKEKLDNLLKIKQELLARAVLKEKLETFAKKVEVDKKMQQDYDSAVDEFALKTGEILKKYDVDDQARESFINQLLTLKQSLAYGLSQEPDQDK